VSNAVREFSTGSLDYPIDAIIVPEAKYSVAEYNDDANYIATLGLYVCKGLVLYNPSVKRGLVGHLSYTEDLDRSMETMLNAFDSNLRDSEVSVIQTQSNNGVSLYDHWPSTNTIADYLLNNGANEVNVDLNVDNRFVRGIALDLKNGNILEEVSRDQKYITSFIWGKSEYIENWW